MPTPSSQLQHLLLNPTILPRSISQCSSMTGAVWFWLSFKGHPCTKLFRSKSVESSNMCKKTSYLDKMKLKMLIISDYNIQFSIFLPYKPLRITSKLKDSYLQKGNILKYSNLWGWKSNLGFRVQR